MYPDGSAEDAEYDGNGSLIRTTDANGKSVLYAYDALNRLIRITQPGDAVTGFGYDSNDNTVSVTDAENRITSYTYDDMGRQTAAMSPDTGAVSCSYDSAGNLISKTDADGNTVTYEYDALNRITGIHYSGHDVLFSYNEGTNGRGRLTGIRDLSGSYTYTYYHSILVFFGTDYAYTI
jgi:YD repeat-containing protein